MWAMPIFEPIVPGHRIHLDGPALGVSQPRVEARPLQLGDLAAVEPEPAAATTVVEPHEAAEPLAQLLFDEAELARACAAAAAVAASAAERAAAARAADADAALRARLEIAVTDLRADLAERHATFCEVLRRSVASALGALVPRLQEVRLAEAVERILRAAPGQPRPAALVLEVPQGSLDALAASVPALLARAGLEGPCEVRPHDAGDGLVRLSCGDMWSELDAASWAAAVAERVLAALAGSVAPSQREGED
jgi:hypothetical protein